MGLQAEAQAAQIAEQSAAAAAERVKAEQAAASAAALERELNAASADLARARSKIAAGDYDPATTRVLHFVHNPESEAAAAAQRQQLDVLMAERDALQAALASRGAAADAEQHASGTASTEGQGGQADVALALKDAQIVVLQRRLDEANKSVKRLKEVCGGAAAGVHATAAREREGSSKLRAVHACRSPARASRRSGMHAGTCLATSEWGGSRQMGQAQV